MKQLKEFLLKMVASPKRRKKTQKVGELVNVFCRDESKIEEILKYLLEENITFDILGKQALLLSSEDIEQLVEAENGWFDVQQVEDFPEECWEENKKTFQWPATIPDHYEPLPKLPRQKKRPSRR